MVKGNERGAGRNQQLETPKNKNKELKDESQQLEALKSENEELKTKLQESEDKNKGLKERLDRKTSEVNTLTKGREQLEEDLSGVNQALNKKNDELKSKDEELKNETQQLEAFKSENEGLKTKLQESENKIQKLEALKSENESQVEALRKQLESKNKELENNKDTKPSAVDAQGVKSKVNYASASFILSGVCAVGASLATPCLAICAILAVAASVFLALGCHCLYKADTALTDVKVDQSDNRPLLESRS